MQPVSRNITAAAVHRSTEGAASTLVAAGAEGASMAMKKTIKYHNGDTYIGQVDSSGRKNGQGILRMANGDVYKGQFKDGMLHGEGKYTWAEGGEYDGEWSNNKEHGKGIFKDKDGTVKDVVCNNGELLLMRTLALRLKRSMEFIWYDLLNLLLILQVLMVLCAVYCQMKSDIV
eukprot:scaffold786_cov91-Skeletonema_dohrnii-CCMP3373.AAC.3